MFLAAGLLGSIGLMGCTTEEQIQAQESVRDARAQAQRTARRATREAERAVEKAPESALDLVLAAKVRAVLSLSKRLDGAKINVGVEDGVVVLHGTVRNRRQEEVARDIAEDVPGIREVTSKLKMQSE
jgi:osmotically-inducible protein OsmY